MSEGLQIALLIIVIVILYIISGRLQPEEPRFLGLRISFWLGLAGLLVALALFALFKLRQP